MPLYDLDEYVCTKCGNNHELCFCGQKPLAPFDDLDEYVMKVKCSWCGSDMGSKPCDRDQYNKISHSICPKCLKKTMREVI